jgi:hypothetical protein
MVYITVVHAQQQVKMARAEARERAAEAEARAVEAEEAAMAAAERAEELAAAAAREAQEVEARRQAVCTRAGVSCKSSGGGDPGGGWRWAKGAPPPAAAAAAAAEEEAEVAMVMAEEAAGAAAVLAAELEGAEERARGEHVPAGADAGELIVLKGQVGSTRPTREQHRVTRGYSLSTTATTLDERVPYSTQLMTLFCVPCLFHAPYSSVECGRRIGCSLDSATSWTCLPW